MPRPLTTAGACEICGVDPRTLTGWAARGLIPGAFKTPGGHWRFDYPFYEWPPWGASLWADYIRKAAEKLGKKPTDRAAER